MMAASSPFKKMAVLRGKTIWYGISIRNTTWKLTTTKIGTWKNDDLVEVANGKIQQLYLSEPREN
jgi:hypothetical protein